MNILDATILDYVFSVGVALLLIAAYSGLYLFSTWVQESKLRALVEIFVGDAEKRLDGGTQKLTWVLEQIKGRYPRVDIDLVRSMIEAAVVRLPKQGTKPETASSNGHPEWRG